MSRFNLQKQLPPCIVSKELLQQLETMVLQAAADIDGEVYSPSSFSLSISETIGVERLTSVAAYHNTLFPDDTESITLRYRSAYPALNILEIQITFGTSEYLNSLEFSVENDRAREIAIGKSEGIMRHIESHRIRPHVKRLSSGAALSLATYIAFLWLFFYFAPVVWPESVKEVWAKINSYFLIAIGFAQIIVLYKSSIPYSFFKSHKSDTKLDDIKWNWRTLGVGFVAVTALRAISQYFLGF